MSHPPSSPKVNSDYSNIIPNQTQLKSGLYLIPTPIGNLDDITLRALKVLKNLDFLLCEDKRVSRKLLNHYSLDAHLMLYHEHNAEKMRDKVITLLKEGKKIGLISDAGTPLISDPGYKLVRACYQENLYVTSLPGASAVITALTLSGLPSDRFYFGGFLSPKTNERQKQLKKILSLSATLVFYETPNRAQRFLTDCLSVLGNRKIVICRELTKLFEERIEGSCEDLISQCETQITLKGEMVVLIEGKAEMDAFSRDDLIRAIKRLVVQEIPVKQIRDQLIDMTDLSKKELYQLIMEVRDNEI